MIIGGPIRQLISQLGHLDSQFRRILQQKDGIINSQIYTNFINVQEYSPENKSFKLAI